MDLVRQPDAAALCLEMRVVLPLLQMWDHESGPLLQMGRVRVFLSSRSRRESYSDLSLQGKINSFDLGFLTYLRGERQAKRDLPVSACCSNAKMLYFRRACPEPQER